MLSPFPLVPLVFLVTFLSRSFAFLFALPLVSFAFLFALPLVSFAFLLALPLVTLCPFSISLHATLQCSNDLPSP